MSEEAETESEEESVSEADALAEGGTRYRTLEANKSGESSDDGS